MRHLFARFHRSPLRLLLLLACWLTPSARAGLTFTVDLYVSDGTYNFYTPLATNSSGAALPFGQYSISSPSWPTNGATTQYTNDDNGFNNNGQNGNSYSTLAQALQQITNGTWVMVFSNATTTNTYHFTVSLPGGLTTNQLPATFITSPADGANNVTNLPTFTWQGQPTNWPVNGSAYIVQFPSSGGMDSFYDPTIVTGLQSNWTTVFPVPASNPDTLTIFNLDYATNYTSDLFVAATPVNTNNSQSFSGWVYKSTIESGGQIQFTVGAPPATGTNFAIVAHYTFDNSGDLGLDTTTNMNSADCYSTWGGNMAQQFTSDAEVGGGALQFFGQSSLTPCGGSPSLTSWTNTLMGSFTVSVWLKTSTILGNDNDFLSDGDGQSVIYLNNNGNGVLPLGITGTKAAIETGVPSAIYGGDTLNSATSITTGSYVHVVTTRDQGSGLKQIFINGVLDASDYGEPGIMDGAPDYASIGGQSSGAFTGELDDVQIYAGVLDSNSIASLYQNPGSEAVDQNFNAALSTTNLQWSTSGDTSWFVEATNTLNSPNAAESGVVTNNQVSVLQTTVVGPGNLNFWWEALDPQGDDEDYEVDFADNGSIMDSLYPVDPWTQDTFTLGPGTHVLTWTANANGDSDPSQATYLDLVTYTQIGAPVITVNPFDQTNYPGYPVALVAADTDSSNTTWQWYKVGTGAIANATTAFFVPTNSGSSSVAGNYYAIATTSAGSASTTTNTVTFMNAPLPPDWSTAFKSLFQAQDSSQVYQDYSYGAVLDTNGNIYAAAEFGGNTTFGSSNLNSGSGGDAAAVTKQSAAGVALWAVAITNSGNGSASALCVATAPGGGVYLAGNYSGTDWLGTNELPVSANEAIFLARFDANGSNLWLKTYGGTSGNFLILNSLASDAAGNVTLSALFGSGAFSIGTNQFSFANQSDVLFQLAPAGTVVWAQPFPSEFIQSVAYNAGRLYVSFNSATSGGGTNATVGNVTNATDRAWVVAALNDTNGLPVWIRGVGAPYNSASGNPYSVGLIDDGPLISASGSNIFLAGVAYSSNAAFGNLTVNFNALRGEYLARYDTNGNAQAAATFGSVTTTPRAVVADGNGNIYVGGLFDNFSYFGKDMLATPESVRPYNGDFSQSFLAKFDVNGNPLWARQAVSTGTVNLLGIALATNGVWASGWSLSGNFPAVIPAVFGSINVFSDGQFVSGGAGGGTTIIWHPGGFLANIVDVQTNVTLYNLSDNSTSFQFSFQSLSGQSHHVEYTTNLVGATWQTYTNVTGDGSVKTLQVPLSLFNSSKQGFVRIHP